MSTTTESEATAAEGRAYDGIVDLLRDVPQARRTRLCRDALDVLVAEDQAYADEQAGRARWFRLLKATADDDALPQRDPTEPPLFRWVLVLDDGREVVAFGKFDAYRTGQRVHGVLEQPPHGVARFYRRSPKATKA